MSSSIGAGTQLRRSQVREHKAGRADPRLDVKSQGTPFVGSVANVHPAVPLWQREVRRRDVGEQKYGSGMPSFNSHVCDRHGICEPRKPSLVTAMTSHGPIGLPDRSRDFNFMPDASAIEFLTSQYVGSSAPVPPDRYYR